MGVRGGMGLVGNGVLCWSSGVGVQELYMGFVKELWVLEGRGVQICR